MLTVGQLAQHLSTLDPNLPIGVVDINRHPPASAQTHTRIDEKCSRCSRPRHSDRCARTQARAHLRHDETVSVAVMPYPKSMEQVTWAEVSRHCARVQRERLRPEALVALAAEFPTTPPPRSDDVGVHDGETWEPLTADEYRARVAVNRAAATA